MAFDPALRSAELPLVVFVHGSAEMYGSDKVLLNLVAAMAASVRFRPLVLLHESGPLQQALLAAGVEVHVGTVLKITRAMFRPTGVLGLVRLGRRAVGDLDRLIAGRHVALVHSNTLAVLGGALWAWRRQHRHLWHVHEIILKPALVRRGLPWLAERLSQRVIANSSQTRDWLMSQAPGLAARCCVVFNGLPPPPAPEPQASAAFRARIGAADTDVVATLAGRLNHWKGQGLAIEAMALLRRQGRLGPLRLALVGSVFAGQDHILAGLLAQVNERGLGDRVSFVSFVEDIYPVWRASQIAVVPSIEPEPFGMVAIEAMACGLPVVAARHGGLVDIVSHEETGLLFAPRQAQALAEALHRLTHDPALRRGMGDAGARRQRELFSVQRQIEQTDAVYRELMAGT